MRWNEKRTAEALAACPLLLATLTALAGGPRWVAGTSYFDPSVSGRPVVWKNGTLNYFTDLGSLSSTVSQTQADAMVASAASVWSGISTAALTIHAAGSLAEDVNGSNFTNGGSGLTMPADVQSTATNKPLGIIYDADGSVLIAIEGAGASDPLSCNTNGVTVLVDNMASAGTVAHALMIVNGLCATDSAHIALVQYEMMRGFGRVLGLDWSQANEQMFMDGLTPDSLAGWPLMHPVERLCTSSGGACMTGTIAPRTDDIAALNRLYPVTAANLNGFPGKQVTATATISIQGTIRFQGGQGMQGVNVVARPLIAGTGLPDMRYPATTVSGALFTGNAGNAITGYLDTTGNPLSRFGGTDETQEGWYDLSGIPLPPGVATADYQLTLEAVNPLYTGNESVGPYVLGQVAPSGTMPVMMIRGLSPGSTAEQDVTVADSAGNESSGDDGTEAIPPVVPASGEWMALLTGYGHSSWFRWHARANRQITVEAQPVNELHQETEDKARIVIGVWNGDDPLGVAPEVDTLQPFNAVPSGLTLMRFQTGADGDIRIGLADQRGDGRPDYLYRGRVLYGDTVNPQRIANSGGAITIDGMGFRPGCTVGVNGVAGAVTSITPTEITAIAPAAQPGVTGSVDVTVTDPATQGWTTIQGGLSYDAATTDSIGIVTAPSNTVGLGVPLPFTVKTVAADGVTPAGGVPVTFTVTNGTALLGCGQAACVVTATGDGLATMTIAANSTVLAVVKASLTNGANVRAEFTGGTLPEIAPVTGTLYLGAGATFSWTPQAIVLNAGVPYSGQTVSWTTGGGAVVSTARSVSDANGLAAAQVITGPLAAAASATVNACLAGGIPGGVGCAEFTVASVHPEVAGLVALGGTGQTLSVSETPAPVVLRVVDTSGHPMAGAVVNFYQTLRQWTAGCPQQGVCPAAPVLAKQDVQATSAADGSVTLIPLNQPGTATQLDVLAVTGDIAALNFQIVQHP